MNRQVFTLMTVFLMLGALWNGAWGATDGDNAPIYTEATNSTKFNNSYQSFLIGDGTNFLIAGKDVNGFTILSSTAKNLENASNDDILEALWTIEAFKPTPDSPVVFYKIKSKKTNHYLSFKNADGALTVNDKPEVSTFIWFNSEKYDTNGKPLIIDQSANRGITIEGTTVSISSSATLTNLKVYTLNDSKLRVSAESLNQQMDNGFILAAKKGSTDIKVEDNGLLNKKLVAFSFYVSTAFESENEDVKKILGTETITASDKPDLQRIYLAVSGYEDLMKYVKEGTYTIDIKEKQFDTEDNTKILWEAKDVIAAFKKATFVAVDKIQNYHPIESKPGLGYQYATFLGKDLLTTDTKKVPIQNAQFCIKNSSSIGSTSTSDYLIITNPFALFPNGNGDMTGSAVEVRPYIREGEVSENQKYYLTSAPINQGIDKWTQIGFTSGGGIVDYDHFKKKKYSVTIADKKIEDTEGGVYYHYLSELSVYGWLISPSTGRYKGDDQKDYFNPKFEEPTEILADKPEGQWIFQYNDQDGFRMYNRESSEYITLGKRIYKVNGEDNLYHIPGGIQGNIAGFPQKFTIDTLRLTTTDKGGLYGYAHSENSGDAFDPVVLKNTAYRLGIQNGTFDKSIVFVQKSLTHNNTLVVDVKSEEGLYFYLVPCETVSYGITQPREEEEDDKAGYYDPTNKKDPIDNLKRIKYALQERTSKRYVIYDNANRRFMLSDDYDDVDKALEEAAKFFFKEKDNAQYILLYCEGKYSEDDKKIWYDETRDKMYANIGDACLHKINMYTKDIADKFGFHSSESPMFVDIMKRLKGDNDTTLVKINLYSVQNRSGNQKYMLAAGQNNFLVEGIPDTRSDIIINSKAIGGLAYDSIKFSITVDTAYVRRTYMTDEDGKRYLSSVMPLYYLGMSSQNPQENVSREDSIYVRPFPGCDKCDYYILNPKVSGNYLFVMTDSIEHGLDNIVKREDHCYHYWNTHHPRLRFVHATHEEDTMIVTSIHRSPKDTLIGGKITTKIEAMKETEWLAPQIYDKNAPDNRPNYGLFAFEVNPNPFDPEVPEYALWNPASKKYIAYVNGNLIMEDQPSYYTLDIKSEGHSIVSNEMVRTSDVRVVASEGKVIIQNAAGKKVFLQTALGKTLANTVLTSDQEEMAAPAGIVFVTVEGEETVKTIVK